MLPTCGRTLSPLVIPHPRRRWWYRLGCCWRCSAWGAGLCDAYGSSLWALSTMLKRPCLSSLSRVTPHTDCTGSRAGANAWDLCRCCNTVATFWSSRSPIAS